MNHFLKTHAICFFAALSNLVSYHNSSNMLRSYKGTTDFPNFGRENPRGWFRWCNRYFMLSPVSAVEKILLASMNLTRKVEYWYIDYIEGRQFMGLNSFSNMLMDRFLEGEDENMKGDFNKLKQEGTIE